MVDQLLVDDVSVRFGGLTALDHVSLTVGTGEVVGVIGPNGAGKTTLFNVICGFTRPSSGALTWQGQRLRRHRPHELTDLGIARTLQGVGLFHGLTVRENVMAGASTFRKAGFFSALLGLPYSDNDERRLGERADAALALAGCGDMSARLPSSLPYPVQKQVALARALVAEPSLLLLDEPAGGLGAEDMAALGATIRAMHGQRAVLLVEHHMDLVMSVCDRVVVLDFGRVIASGTPKEIQADPAVARAYLGEDVVAHDANAGPPKVPSGSWTSLRAAGAPDPRRPAHKDTAETAESAESAEAAQTAATPRTAAPTVSPDTATDDATVEEVAVAPAGGPGLPTQTAAAANGERPARGTSRARGRRS